MRTPAQGVLALAAEAGSELALAETVTIDSDRWGGSSAANVGSSLQSLPAFARITQMQRGVLRVDSTPALPSVQSG